MGKKNRGVRKIFSRIFDRNILKLILMGLHFLSSVLAVTNVSNMNRLRHPALLSANSILFLVCDFFTGTTSVRQANGPPERTDGEPRTTTPLQQWMAVSKKKNTPVNGDPVNGDPSVQVPYPLHEIVRGYRLGSDSIQSRNDRDNMQFMMMIIYSS